MTHPLPQPTDTTGTGSQLNLPTQGCTGRVWGGRVPPAKRGEPQQTRPDLLLYHDLGVNSVSSIPWPGIGKQCDLSAIEFREIRCPTGDYSRTTPYHGCGRRECPTCWSTAVRKVARDVARKVWAYNELRGSYPPREVFLVPPRGLVLPDMPAEAGLRKIYAWAASLLPTLGVVAFTLTPHLFHLQGEYSRAFNDEASRRGRLPDGRKCSRYDILREHINQGEPSEKFTEFYPHLHAITYGYVNADAVPPGVIVKTNSRPIRSEDSLCNKLFYVLSHAAMIPGRRSIRDYGAFRQMTIVGERVNLVEQFCPVCHSRLVDQWGNPAECKVLCITYAFTGRTTPTRPPPSLVGTRSWRRLYPDRHGRVAASVQLVTTPG